MSINYLPAPAPLGQRFPPARLRELRELRIDFTLEALGSDGALSQRELARQLSVALGSANALLRMCVDRGWVRVSPGRGHRCRYVLTAAGSRERLRRHRTLIAAAVPLYASVRRRIAAQFEAFAARWPEPADVLVEKREKRIVFYGSADVVELAYLCLSRTDLRLVAAVCDERDADLPGVPIFGASTPWLTALGDNSFDRLVVLPSRSEPREVQQRLRAAGVRANRIDWF